MPDTGAVPTKTKNTSSFHQKWLTTLGTPLLAILIAFLLGGLVIWVTSGSLSTVGQAFAGMLRGAFIKPRSFSETIIATGPYILLSLAVAIGFKAGLFNIGADGQFFIGAITAALVGETFTNLPAIIHLPLTLLAAILAGALWAGFAGFLKARIGASEVVTTIMMNYIAYRLTELLVALFKDPLTNTVQTPSAAQSSWIWSFYSVPQRLQDPLNALMVGLFFGFLAYILFRWIIGITGLKKRIKTPNQKTFLSIAFGLLVAVLCFVLLPILTRLYWPFTDAYDRLHVGIILAVLAAVLIWWVLWKTTFGFELRMVGANPDAARYAGVNITRTIVGVMCISGGLAALAGAIEVLGVTSCHCQQSPFTTGLGFDAIAIALLAKNDPFGILAASFLFGAILNGASLMEIQSGVSHYIVSLIQGLVLLFVAAPTIITGIFKFRPNWRKKQTTPPTNRSGE